MKYLVPALTQFVITVISKHPEFAKQYIQSIAEIAVHLLSVEMRLEANALQIASTVFERMGQVDDGNFLQQILRGIFTSLHFYRNNTKSKVIPSSIMKCVHSFFGVFMVCNSSQTLIQACDQI